MLQVLNFSRNAGVLGDARRGRRGSPRGYRLPARWIIHTVGPVWKGGTRGESVLLAACYENSLRLAADKQLRSLAFPAISTGAYAYPLKLATEVAVATVRGFLAEYMDFEEIIFCCYSGEDFTIYKRALGQRSA
jgi:O-acetyl-ADP-ribose deacetylase